MTPSEKFAGADLTRLSPADLQTVDECLHVEKMLADDVATYESQKRLAHQNLAIKRVLMTGDWWRRINAKLTALKAARQIIAVRRGVLRQELKTACHRLTLAREPDQNRAFVKAARRKLTGEQIAAIWELARQMEKEEVTA